MRGARATAGAVVAIALSVLGGCGEGEQGTVAAVAETAPAATPEQPERRGPQALAAGALVRLGEASPRWTERKARRPDLRCASRPFEAARATAATDRFELDETSVQESVAVFSDEAASRRAYARLNSDTSMSCLRQRARRRMAEQTEGPPTRPEVTRAESLGKWGVATRLSATGPSQIGTVRGIIDAVHARVGRGVGALMIVSGPGVVSEELYEDVVAEFKRRLDEALG